MRPLSFGLAMFVACMSLACRAGSQAGDAAGRHRIVQPPRDNGGRDSPPAMAVRARARRYVTRFPLTEDPISEGGRWIAGGAVGLDWSNVSTTPGLAIGRQTGASYTDANAILSGAWGPDQSASATVHVTRANDACAQEVELRLRSAISAHVNRGYEISYKSSQSPSAYLIIVRWNGALGSYTYLFKRSGAEFGVKDGDVVSASVVGDLISAYKNGVQMAQATDRTFATGSPGMGFNLENGPPGCAGTNRDYGFTSFAATDSIGG